MDRKKMGIKELLRLKLQVENHKLATMTIRSQDAKELIRLALRGAQRKRTNKARLVQGDDGVFRGRTT